MGAVGTFPERRTAPRHRTLKAGRVTLNRSSVFNCTVRNVSATGARLEMANTLGLPADFVIAISGEGERRCRIAWRGFGVIGVAFA